LEESGVILTTTKINFGTKRLVGCIQEDIDMAQRTLRQLAERLNAIIAENDSRGWSERNDLPAMVQIIRHTPTRRVRNTYFEVSYVSSAQHTIGGRSFCGGVTVSDENQIEVLK
jgi:hypothetical protein